MPSHVKSRKSDHISESYLVEDTTENLSRAQIQLNSNFHKIVLCRHFVTALMLHLTALTNGFRYFFLVSQLLLSSLAQPIPRDCEDTVVELCAKYCSSGIWTVAAVVYTASCAGSLFHFLTVCASSLSACTLPAVKALCIFRSKFCNHADASTCNMRVTVCWYRTHRFVLRPPFFRLLR